MEKLHDSLSYDLAEEAVIVTDTIRVSATLVGIIQPDTTEDALAAAIRSKVEQFIPNVEWQFSNTIRRPHGSGWQEVTMTATTRAPVSEHGALDRRREESDAGKVGVKIANYVVDATPPVEDVRRTEAQLRAKILQLAMDEAKAISQATGRTYRVGHINFTKPNSNSPRAIMAASYLEDTVVAGASPGVSSEITNTMRLSMIGNIELRTTP